MEQTLSDLKTRRSIRKYKPEQVPDELLDKILEAGSYAPTGMNRQSPLILAIRDRELIGKISALNAKVMGSDRDPFYGAPCLIVVFADRNVWTHVEDGSLVMGNLMNAAHALGLGSCWIHRAREVFETEEGRIIKRTLGIDEKYIGIGNCIVGYTDGDYPEARPRREGYIVKVD